MLVKVIGEESEPTIKEKIDGKEAELTSALDEMGFDVSYRRGENLHLAIRTAAMCHVSLDFLASQEGNDLSESDLAVGAVRHSVWEIDYYDHSVDTGLRGILTGVLEARVAQPE